MPRECSHLDPCSCSPEPDVAVGPCRRHALAVGRKGDSEDEELLAVELLPLFAAVHVPKADRLVMASRSQHLTVGREGDGIDLETMAIAAPKFLARSHLPQADRFAAGSQKGAVVRERQTPHPALMANEPMQLLAGGRVP